MYKVSPHGKLPIPNNQAYNIDPNTYDREFFQEDGLEGSFVIDLIEAIGMEVDVAPNFVKQNQVLIYVRPGCPNTHIYHNAQEIGIGIRFAR